MGLLQTSGKNVYLKSCTVGCAIYYFIINYSIPREEQENRSSEFLAKTPETNQEQGLQRAKDLLWSSISHAGINEWVFESQVAWDTSRDDSLLNIFNDWRRENNQNSEFIKWIIWELATQDESRIWPIAENWIETNMYENERWRTIELRTAQNIVEQGVELRTRLPHFQPEPIEEIFDHYYQLIAEVGSRYWTVISTEEEARREQQKRILSNKRND